MHQDVGGANLHTHPFISIARGKNTFFSQTFSLLGPFWVFFPHVFGSLFHFGAFLSAFSSF